MSTVLQANDRRETLISRGATDAAFRAGQRLGTLLIERGLEAARAQSGETVTTDQIMACLDEALLRQLREELLADFDHGASCERREAA